jgi:HK97 gp10 family phage protein
MASNRFDISMLGVPELSQALAALPEKLERKVLTKALRQAGKYYLMLAKARAPRDQGRLSSTMKLRALKRRKGRVGVMIQTGTRSELGIDPKQRGYYPAHTEFGHRDRAGVHHPANPYMRTSLKTGESAMVAILRQEIDNGIEAEMRGSA